MKRFFYSAIVILFYLPNVLQSATNVVTDFSNAKTFSLKKFSLKTQKKYTEFRNVNLEIFAIESAKLLTNKVKKADSIPLALNTTYSECEAEFGIGKSYFVITNADILVNGKTTGVTVSYHKTQSNANAGIFPLSSPYYSASGTIYARVVNNSTLQFNTSVVTLIVKSSPGVTIIGDSIVCGGIPLPLSAIGTYSGGASYLSSSWSFATASDYKIASVDKTGSVSGKTGGNATVKCSIQDNTGCSNFATKLITVTPTLKSISALSTICSRDSATVLMKGLLTDNIFSIVYHINDIQKFDTVKNIVSDATGNAQFKAQVFSVNNVAIPANTQYLTIDRLTDKFGCTVVFNKQTGVTVFPLPIPNFSGPTNVCSDDKIILTSSYTLPAGTSFVSDAWSSTNTNVASVNNGIVTGISGGTANISYTVKDSRSCDSTMIKTITVLSSLDPQINISASATTICIGTPTLFSAEIKNGGKKPFYQWLKNNIRVGTNAPFYADNTIKNEDIISCSLMSDSVCSNSNTSISNLIKMRVVSYPLITITSLKNAYFENDSGITLRAKPPGGIFFVDSVKTVSFTPSVLKKGIHKVQYYYTDSSGCSNSQIIFVEVVSATKQDFSIYPNPAYYDVTLKMNTDKPEKMLMELTDIAGYVLMQQTLSMKQGANLKTIYIADLPDGIYFMILRTENGLTQKVFRLIKNE